MPRSFHELWRKRTDQGDYGSPNVLNVLPHVRYARRAVRLAESEIFFVRFRAEELRTPRRGQIEQNHRYARLAILV